MEFISVRKDPTSVRSDPTPESIFVVRRESTPSIF